MSLRCGLRAWPLLSCQIRGTSRMSPLIGAAVRHLQTSSEDCSAYKIASESDQTVDKALHSSIEGTTKYDHYEDAPQLNDFTERTHTCSQLRASDVGRRVVLFGWVSFKRLFFLLVRDGYGVTQVVVEGDAHKEFIEKLSLESVIRVEGVVRHRPEGQSRSNMPTGEIEVLAEELSVLNAASDLPFVPREYQKKHEALRLQYRYLDLRQEEMQHNLRLRSKFTHAVRTHLIEQLGFCEVETPTLFRRTPGGAQEFPVACHSYPAQFYSLTQSPQQFKQLLMVGGIDRYFQIARCYRDETARPDRQPEFTQIDLEMSFVQQCDVMNVVEELIRFVWPKRLPDTPFPILSHREAMSKYGTDQPDTRYGFLLEEASTLFPGLLKEGAPNLPFNQRTAMMIRWPGGARRVKSNVIDDWRKIAQDFGRTGVVRVSMEEGRDIPPSLGRHADVEQLKARVRPGDLFVVAWGGERNVQRVLGKVRKDLAEISGTLNNIEPEYNFLWVTDFPLFSKEKEVLTSEHHPFTAPVPEDEPLLSTEPEKVRGQHFDLVLNGWEVGGGSIRIHDAAMQTFVLKDILGEDTSQLNHLLQALAMGAPPHGGFAFGLDRLLAIICKAPSIRDVIAFPKSSEGRDLMADSPAPLSPEDLVFFHLTGVKGAAGDKS